MILSSNTEQLYQSSFYLKYSYLIEDLFRQKNKVCSIEDSIIRINNELENMRKVEDSSLKTRVNYSINSLPVDDLASNVLGMCGNIKEVISLFNLYKESKKKKYQKAAENLLENIFDKCSLSTPISYGSGLCGVGIGVEYLLQNKFVIGNSDEVLSDIDNRVFSEINDRNLVDLSIDNGILGLGYYLYFRLYYRKGVNERPVLDLKEHVIYLIDWIDDILKHICICGLLRYELYFILNLLNQLDVFPSKIKKLMQYCLES